jgi:protein phosphatase 2C-like protein
MDVSFATAAAPGRRNEDLVLAGDDFVVVLDGVTSPPDLVTGCVHDPVWLVRTLGSALVDLLVRHAESDLRALLAGAIAAVRAAHAGTCDLSHPESPSSTVAILRERPDQVDYLVLCDSAVVLAGPHGRIVDVVTDRRTERMRGRTRREVARWRNRDGGFWVASTDPGAAEQALTGTVPRVRLGSALLCTDGVARLVDYFGREWQDVVDLAAAGSLRDVLRAVRTAENPGPPPGVRKQHDDATVARCLFGGSASLTRRSVRT